MSTEISPFLTGFTCKCPACGKGKLYKTFLTVADNCTCCGFPLKEHDAADGPAYIAMCIIGALATFLALITEVLFYPPLWLHAVLWFPLIIGGSIVCLRLAKSVLISLQYAHRREDFGGND